MCIAWTRVMYNIYTYIHNSYTGTRCRDFWRQKVITWWWKNFCATLTPKTYRTTILANSLNPSRQQKLRLCVCMKTKYIYIYTCASFWIEKRAYKETWRHQKMIVNIEYLSMSHIIPANSEDINLKNELCHAGRLHSCRPAGKNEASC